MLKRLFEEHDMNIVRGRCVICTANFFSSNIAALPCGHTFHFQCVSQWLEHSKTCPNCRVRTSERQVVKQLFFDTADDTQESQIHGENFAAKVEELTISLQKEKDDHEKNMAKLHELKKSISTLETKLEREKERFRTRVPGLEARNRQLEMMLEDQQGLQRELEKKKGQLKACEFFKIVSNGSSFESGIDKYVNSCGDPDAGQFLVLLRRQLDESKKIQANMYTDIQKYEKKIRESEKKETDYKNLIQALRKEADELRLMANKNTPYNPKLKKVFDHSPPRRPSLGFDETIDFNQDLIDSAFKLTKPKATFVSKLESDTRSGERFSFNYVSVVKEDKELDFPKFPDVDSLDDDSMLDVTIPKSIIDRVISGSPKKKPNGLGGLQRPAVAALENLEFRDSGCKFSSNLSKKIIKRKNIESTKLVGKTRRLTQFFERETSSDTIVTID